MLAAAFAASGVESVEVVAGGQYPKLTEQVLLDALAITPRARLPGLRVVIVERTAADAGAAAPARGELRGLGARAVESRRRARSRRSKVGPLAHRSRGVANAKERAMRCSDRWLGAAVLLALLVLPVSGSAEDAKAGLHDCGKRTCGEWKPKEDNTCRSCSTPQCRDAEQRRGSRRHQDADRVLRGPRRAAGGGVVRGVGARPIRSSLACGSLRAALLLVFARLRLAARNLQAACSAASEELQHRIVEEAVARQRLAAVAARAAGPRSRWCGRPPPRRSGSRRRRPTAGASAPRSRRSGPPRRSRGRARRCRRGAAPRARFTKRAKWSRLSSALRWTS